MKSLGVAPSPRLVAATVIVLSLLLLVPAIVMGDAIGWDAVVHVNWQAHFADEVWRGTLYPRWLPRISHGFGSPAFFFYPPLAQWLGALFHPLLPAPEQAMNRLFLGLWISTVLGAWGFWLWLRAVTVGRTATFFALLCFLLLPYRCFVDFYLRGALAELTGLNLTPWLLYAATRLAAGKRGGFAGFALATGLLFFCNFPAAEIGILLGVGYLVALTGWRDLRTLAIGAGATLTGFLIGAAPVATTLFLLQVLPDTANLWSVRNSPPTWLLFSGRPWVDPTMYAMTIMTIVLTLAGASIAGALTLSERNTLRRRTGGYLLGVIGVVVLLNTAIAEPFWFRANPLSRIQFPFRLLAATTIALAGMAGLAMERAHRRGQRTILWLAVPALLLVDAGLVSLQNYRNRYTRHMNASQMIADNTDAMLEFVLGDLRTLDRRFGSAPAVAIAGRARINEPVLQQRRLTMIVDTPAGATLALRQFAFTGWECRIDAAGWTPARTLPRPYAVPVCTAPPGRHRLSARMPPTRVERIGNALTLLGLASAAAALVWSLTRRRVAIR